MKNITALTIKDQGLINGVLKSTHWKSHPYCYEDSFAFYAHRGGFFPMKYYDGELLIPFFYREKRFHIIRPLGNGNEAKLIEFANYLKSTSNRPVTFLKLTFELFSNLNELIPLKKIVYSSNLNEIEDDRYPQLLLNINETLHGIENERLIISGKVKKFAYLRRAISNCDRVTLDNKTFKLQKLAPKHIPSLLFFFDKWKNKFKERYTKSTDNEKRNIVIPENDEFIVRPYKCLLHRFNSNIDQIENFSYLAFIDNEVVGFIFLGKNSHRSLALYANLALTDYDYLSYYIIYRVMKLKEIQKFKFINLGGQEVKHLKQFFMKFRPKERMKNKHKPYNCEYE